MGNDEKDITKEEFDFMYDDDLIPIFNKLGIKDAFENGKIKCSTCDKVITFENLHSLYLDKDAVKMVCNDKKCVKLLNKDT